MGNYLNYSSAHFDKAKTLCENGDMSMSAALYLTQSTLPNQVRIKDDVELMYPNIIEVLK